MFIVLLVVGYFFLGVSNLEVSTLSAQLQDGDLPPSTLPCDPVRLFEGALALPCADGLGAVWIAHIHQDLVPPSQCLRVDYCGAGDWWMGSLCFIWYRLTSLPSPPDMVLGGIGLIALPFDLITSFLHRPLPITKGVLSRSRCPFIAKKPTMPARSRLVRRPRPSFKLAWP